MRVMSTLLALGMLAVAASAAIHVEVARPQGVDYSSYGSFGFKVKEDVPDEHPLGAESPLLEQLREVAKKELLARGMTFIDGGSPDLWITFFGLGQEDLSIEGTSREVGPVTWVGDPGAHSSRTVIHATLLIEVWDAASGERVWSGWATGESTNREKLRARAPRAARKILEAFPVE